MGATLSRPLVDGVGIVFPAYKTVLCLEDGAPVQEKNHWLQYWAVFGAFRLVEYIADRFVLWYVFRERCSLRVPPCPYARVNQVSENAVPWLAGVQCITLPRWLCS